MWQNGHPTPRTVIRPGTAACQFALASLNGTLTSGHAPAVAGSGAATAEAFGDPSKSGVERYRSPELAAMVTMTLPRFSRREATRTAAATLAPLLMPTKIPSSRKTPCPGKCLFVGHGLHAGEQARVEVLGDKACSDALNLMRPRFAPGNHGRIDRLDGDRP